MESTNLETTRASKATRRAVAAGAVWTVPAVIMATPASAAPVASGAYSWQIVTTETTAANQRSVTVGVTVTNFGQAFSISGVTQNGYVWTKGNTTVVATVGFTAQNVPTGDFNTDPPNTTLSFNVTLQGGNEGGGAWTYGTLTFTWSGGSFTLNPPNPVPLLIS